MGDKNRRSKKESVAEWLLSSVPAAMMLESAWEARERMGAEQGSVWRGVFGGVVLVSQIFIRASSPAVRSWWVGGLNRVARVVVWEAWRVQVIASGVKSVGASSEQRASQV